MGGQLTEGSSGQMGVGHVTLAGGQDMVGLQLGQILGQKVGGQVRSGSGEQIGEGQVILAHGGQVKTGLQMALSGFGQLMRGFGQIGVGHKGFGHV